MASCPEIMNVSYDEEEMCLAVQLSTGTWVYGTVHLQDYREFQASGFSYDYYASRIVGCFASWKA